MDIGMGEMGVLVSGTSGGWPVVLGPSREAATDIDRLSLPVPPGDLDAQSLVRLQQDLVRAISSVTGYERVMLYQFHPNWSGEVLAIQTRVVSGATINLTELT